MNFLNSPFTSQSHFVLLTFISSAARIELQHYGIRPHLYFRTNPLWRTNMNNLNFLKIGLMLSLLFTLNVFVFSQVDVARKTMAVTYPLDEDVFMQFRGSTRFPRLTGKGKVRRTGKSGTKVEIEISKLPRPFELGAGYATYVLWAISPDGQVDNLGEIKRRGTFEFDSKISVTTPLQTFALIITAEPHFLVRRPSRAVMLENLNPYMQTGKAVATSTVVEYFGNSSDYFSDARTPEIAEFDYSKTPSAILQAKQAIALARFAGAQRDALEELQQAETLLQNAENGWKADRPDEMVDIAARQAISAAVKAETTAIARREAREKRNEKTRQDAEIRESENRVQDIQNEMAELRAELARETRSRELAERDALNYSNQVKELRQEIGRLREELGQIRTDAENAKGQLARIVGEKQAEERRREEANRLAQFQANQGVLIQSLRKFGTVEQTERGIVLTLPENFWTTTRVSTFAPTAEPKLTALGEILANNNDYKIVIESHTDNKGTPEELETLTAKRAQSIADKMLTLGVTQSRIEARGFGAALPVAPNTTNANRAKNRRVQVVLVPNL
jgi:outer membrane protein OmpA-like peptidoglycan-associated protein